MLGMTTGAPRRRRRPRAQRAGDSISSRATSSTNSGTPSARCTTCVDQRIRHRRTADGGAHEVGHLGRCQPVERDRRHGVRRPRRRELAAGGEQHQPLRRRRRSGRRSAARRPAGRQNSTVVGSAQCRSSMTSTRGWRAARRTSTCTMVSSARLLLALRRLARRVELRRESAGRTPAPAAGRRSATSSPLSSSNRGSESTAPISVSTIGYSGLSVCSGVQRLSSTVARRQRAAELVDRAGSCRCPARRPPASPRRGPPVVSCPAPGQRRALGERGRRTDSRDPVAAARRFADQAMDEPTRCAPRRRRAAPAQIISPRSRRTVSALSSTSPGAARACQRDGGLRRQARQLAQAEHAADALLARDHQTGVHADADLEARRRGWRGGVRPPRAAASRRSLGGAHGATRVVLVGLRIAEGHHEAIGESADDVAAVAPRRPRRAAPAGHAASSSSASMSGVRPASAARVRPQQRIVSWRRSTSSAPPQALATR